MNLLLALALSASAVSYRGAVATGHPLASEAAAEVLRRGGNAADAAVAAAFVLSVVEPQSSGIGGGGFALVHDARTGRTVALDFREVAPAAASADMFATAPAAGPSPSLDGGKAVAVPGAVAGYAELARRFGTRRLRDLVEPAARLAERGFPAGRHWSARAERRLACLAARPAAAAELLSRRPDGTFAPPRVGEARTRRELARTLRTIGRDPRAFYEGPLAAAIVRAVREDGGVLAPADLARYRVRERTPLEGRYRGHRILSMPLPSSGGSVVIGLLQALEGDDPRAGGYRPVEFLHAMAEVSKRLYARRARLGDPDHAPGAAAVEAETIDLAFARALRAAVGPRASSDVGPPPAPAESGNTSHLSVIDGEGNAVALTTTVNWFFGSCVVVPGTGILLNDQMDDFDAAPGRANAFGLVGAGANAPAPGKAPLSSMAPTLAFGPDGRLWLAAGAAGGSTIPTSVAQLVSHIVDDGMSLEQALGEPRLHHQWRPPALQVERNGLEAETARALEARGHVLDVKEPWGNAHAVRVHADGLVEGASDPRLDGAAAAP